MTVSATVSALMQVAVGALAGALAMLAGIIIGHLSGWRDVSAILDELGQWMEGQERINATLLRRYDRDARDERDETPTE